MKNIKKKMAFLFIGLCTVSSFYSFNQKKKSKDKKYEVIRTTNSEITVYDTIISADSKFTPNDFIQFLGFENDEDIQIIDIDKGSFFYKKDSEGTNTNSTTNIEVISLTNTDELNDLTKKEIKIMKHIEIDVSDMGINIDSIIESVMANHLSDSIIIKTIMINDSNTIVHNTEDIDFKQVSVFSSDNPNQDSNKIIIKGTKDNVPNITLLIVSDADESTEKIKQNILNQNSNLGINLYPNPAENTAEIQFNLDEKVETTIQIIDLKGQVLQNINLGKIAGKHTQKLDLSKLSKGTYIINIKKGSETFNQKLVVK